MVAIMTRPTVGHRARSRRRVRGAVGRFVAAYGWRAYALPMLVAVTVAVLAHPRVDGRATVAARAGSARSTVGPIRRPAQTAPPATVVLGPLTDSTACGGSTAGSLVVVSISLQRVWMCQAGRVVKSSAVTTGAVDHGDATPTGSWLVQGKQTDRYLVGPGYRDFVRYWVPFNGDFGFHDASWQTMPFGAGGYRTQGSNGCVHLPLAVMAWLYRWVRVGQTVVTVTAG
jgi:lipoprotein-anchoring transpeptidase ErfK/SrfK